MNWIASCLSTEKVAPISSYDWLTDPVDLRIARTNLDWPDVEALWSDDGSKGNNNTDSGKSHHGIYRSYHCQRYWWQPSSEEEAATDAMDSLISAGSTSNDIELNMKHVTIAATVNDYYNKQCYQCVTSANCTSNNASQVLKKMRQLIYCLHYLAQDDMSTIAWCKTPPIQEQKTGLQECLPKAYLFKILLCKSYVSME